jgi:transcription initiation factor TFIIB
MSHPDKVAEGTGTSTTEGSGRKGRPPRCPECGSTVSVEDYESGEVACQGCGLVLSGQVVNRGPEWRAFTKEQRDERTRTGPPTTYTVGKGLSTEVGFAIRDGRGRRLSPSQKVTAKTLQKWHIRTQMSNTGSGNLIRATLELDRIAGILHVPLSVKEQAALMYRRLLKKRLTRGRSIVEAAAACLYAACRISRTSRSLDEIAKAANAEKKDVARIYRLLLRTWEIVMPLDDPVRCVSKIANKINVTTRIERASIEILEKAREMKLTTGRSPRGLAAAALYIACILEKRRDVTQANIALAADVTEVTVRNRYKDIMRNMFETKDEPTATESSTPP